MKIPPPDLFAAREDLSGAASTTRPNFRFLARWREVLASDWAQASEAGLASCLRLAGGWLAFVYFVWASILSPSFFAPIWLAYAALLTLQSPAPRVAPLRALHRWLRAERRRRIWMRIIFALASFSLGYAYAQDVLGEDATFVFGFAVFCLLCLGVGVLPHFVDLRSRGDITHGSAGFAEPIDLREWGDESAADGGPLVGRLDIEETAFKTADNRLVRDLADGHGLTVAPTRSGKGVSSIIPQLLDYKGSILCIDPKGENARVTARRRQEFGDVFIIDPWGIASGDVHPARIPPASYDPLARLRADSASFADDCRRLANSIVKRSGNEGDGAYWKDRAEALITGIIAYISTSDRIQHRSLALLAHLLAAGTEQVRELLGAMADEGPPAASSAANVVLGMAEKEFSLVLSSAEKEVNFLSSPAMMNAFDPAPDHGRVVDFSDLKFKGGTTVYVVIPPAQIDTYASYLRVLLVDSVMSMTAAGPKPQVPVLFLIDEFPALGHLKTIEVSMGLMAGYGVRLHPYIQDMSQLRAIYKEKAQTFSSNASTVQIFGINDIETAREISETLGDETLFLGAERPSISRRLSTPDELMRMDREMQLVFRPGERPALLKKIKYYEDPEFAGLFDQDPERTGSGKAAE